MKGDFILCIWELILYVNLTISLVSCQIILKKGLGLQITTRNILSTKSKPSLGKEVGQNKFEKQQEQTKEVIVQFQLKKPYTFTEKFHDWVHVRNLSSGQGKMQDIKESWGHLEEEYKLKFKKIS